MYYIRLIQFFWSAEYSGLLQQSITGHTLTKFTRQNIKKHQKLGITVDIVYHICKNIVYGGKVCQKK